MKMRKVKTCVNGTPSLKGRGGPTDDLNLRALSTGESVLPADTTQAIGGAPAVKALIDATHTPVAEPGRVPLARMAMADGGPVGFGAWEFGSTGKSALDQMIEDQRKRLEQMRIQDDMKQIEERRAKVAEDQQRRMSNADALSFAYRADGEPYVKPLAARAKGARNGDYVGSVGDSWNDEFDEKKNRRSGGSPPARWAAYMPVGNPTARTIGGFEDSAGRSILHGSGMGGSKSARELEREGPQIISKREQGLLLERQRETGGKLPKGELKDEDYYQLGAEERARYWTNRYKMVNGGVVGMKDGGMVSLAQRAKARGYGMAAGGPVGRDPLTTVWSPESLPNLFGKPQDYASYEDYQRAMWDRLTPEQRILAQQAQKTAQGVDAETAARASALDARLAGPEFSYLPPATIAYLKQNPGMIDTVLANRPNAEATAFSQAQVNKVKADLAARAAQSGYQSPEALAVEKLQMARVAQPNAAAATLEAQNRAKLTPQQLLEQQAQGRYLDPAPAAPTAAPSLAAAASQRQVTPTLPSATAPARPGQVAPAAPLQRGDRTVGPVSLAARAQRRPLPVRGGVIGMANGGEVIEPLPGETEEEYIARLRDAQRVADMPPRPAPMDYGAAFAPATPAPLAARASGWGMGDRGAGPATPVAPAAAKPTAPVAPPVNYGPMDEYDPATKKGNAFAFRDFVRGGADPLEPQLPWPDQAGQARTKQYSPGGTVITARADETGRVNQFFGTGSKDAGMDPASAAALAKVQDEYAASFSPQTARPLAERAVARRQQQATEQAAETFPLVVQELQQKVEAGEISLKQAREIAKLFAEATDEKRPPEERNAAARRYRQLVKTGRDDDYDVKVLGGETDPVTGARGAQSALVRGPEGIQIITADGRIIKPGEPGSGAIPPKERALAEARAAVAAGKSREAVNARLKQWGYEGI